MPVQEFDRLDALFLELESLVTDITEESNRVVATIEERKLVILEQHETDSDDGGN